MRDAVLDVVGVVLELLVLLEVGFRHFEIEYNSKIRILLYYAGRDQWKGIEGWDLINMDVKAGLD